MKKDTDFEICRKELIESGTIFKSHQINQEVRTNISQKIKSKIENIQEISRKLNCSIGIVGGFVRDLLLERQSEDVDFLVFRGDFHKLTLKIAETMGAKIGKMSNRTLTTQVRFPDEVVFEFNSTRKERYEYPSRVPIVEKASIVEDLQRRDFTINALIMFEDFYIDLFDGTADLQNQLIQTTREPDIVFHEDYLRIFRAIRIACKLGFTLSSKTKKGIRKNATNLLDVPKERILQELKLSFSYAPSRAYRLIRDLKILEVLFPEVKNIELNSQIFCTKDTWTKIEEKIKFLENKGSANVNLFIAMILLEIEAEKSSEMENKDIVQIANEILQKYKFSNREKTEITAYISFRNSLIDMIENPPQDFEIRKMLRKQRDLIDSIILMTKAELSTRTKNLDLDSLLDHIAILRDRKDLIFFEPELNGHEIRKIFKVKGEKIGSIKSNLIEAIMKEEIKNKREDCIAYIEENM